MIELSLLGRRRHPRSSPSELAIDPIEAALFRAAQSLARSPAALRSVIARFLGAKIVLVTTCVRPAPVTPRCSPGAMRSNVEAATKPVIGRA